MATAESRLRAQAASVRRYTSRNTVKRAAHLLVQSAVRSGSLIRGPCECCGCDRSAAHHDDYAKPLAIRWLCRKCHRQWHVQNGEAANSGADPERTKCVTREPTSSTYVGVSWNTEKKRWTARLRRPEGSRVSYHHDEETAAHAYDRYVLELCPGALKINFPRNRSPNQ